ncbi:diguanylate cyclase domain-containing protein [Pseudoalteromonas sp. GB56]
MKIRSKHLLLVLSVLYISASIFIVEFFSNLYQQKEIAEEQEYLAKQVALMRAKVETTVFQEVFAANSIVIIANLDKEFTIKNWHNITSALTGNSNLVRNIALAPNNVIQYVHPFEGNERAIGFDYRTNAEQLATVEKARLSKNVFIAGPLELVQGGTALIVRYPLFTEITNPETYWGTLSVVLDANSLYQLLELEQQGNITYALKGIDGQGIDGPLFFGKEETFTYADTVLSVQIPSGEWALAAKYGESERALSHANTIRLVGATVSLILYFSVLSLARAYYLVKATSLQDDLTHLANRRSIMQRLQVLTKDSKSTKHFAIINIDLNDFKSVNDSYGHDTGDALLVHVANELDEQLRDTDIVARLGGDEFLILLHRVKDEEQVVAIVEKLREHMAQTPLHFKGHEVYASLSFGYSCNSELTLDLENLLSEADARMYEDKRRQKSAATQ